MTSTVKMRCPDGYSEATVRFGYGRVLRRFRHGADDMPQGGARNGKALPHSPTDAICRQKALSEPGLGRRASRRRRGGDDGHVRSGHRKTEENRIHRMPNTPLGYFRQCPAQEAARALLPIVVRDRRSGDS